MNKDLWVAVADAVDGRVEDVRVTLDTHGVGSVLRRWDVQVETKTWPTWAYRVGDVIEVAGLDWQLTSVDGIRPDEPGSLFFRAYEETGGGIDG